MVDFKIGADPELFVRDRNGNLVSAYGMIPGTKYDPYKVEGGAVQVDGMALEFNIDPASSVKEFNNNITNVLRQLKEMIPAGYEFDFSPVAEFGKEYIESQPEEARELGCDPDFNALTGLPNPKPNVDYPFRTASGHIHIGWTEGQDIDVPEHIEACRMATQQLDVTIGLACRAWDKDTKRSSMYGKFSAYRPKHYGVEYRTLSNTWVNYEDRRTIVYEFAVEAMKRLLNGQRIYDNWIIREFDDMLTYGDHRTLISWGERNTRSWKGNKLLSNIIYPEGKNDKIEKKVGRAAIDINAALQIPAFQAFAGNAVVQHQAVVDEWGDALEALEEEDDLIDDDIEFFPEPEEGL